MGKTKTKIMDDSQIVEEKPLAKGKKPGRRDELVERLKAELGAEEKVSQGERVPQVPQGEEPRDTRDTLTTRGTPKPIRPRSKKYREALKDLDKSSTGPVLDKSKSYSLNEALELVKKGSYTKFIGTLEAHINTHQKGLRGLVSLPFASGKKLRILAFGSTPDQTLEGVILGSDDVIDSINKGPSASSGLNFDLVITTPDWMPRLAKIARILGPRGLMPNPKNGTITNPSADGLKKAVEGFQTGKTEYKTESKAPVIHIGLGKLNQPTEELSANVKMLIQTIGKTKVKKITLSPTMGPAVKVDLSSI